MKLENLLYGVEIQKTNVDLNTEIKEIKIEEQARRQRRKSKHHPMQVFPFIFYKRYFLHKTSLASIVEGQKPSRPSAVFMTGLLYHNSENSRFFSAVLQ